MKTDKKLRPSHWFVVLIVVAAGLGWFYLYRPLLQERHLKKATVLVEAEQYQDALPLLEGLITAGSSTGEQKPLFLLAKSYTELGNDKAAYPLWEKLGSDVSSSYREEALFYLGRLARKGGNFNRAEELLREHDKEYPHSSQGGMVQLALARLAKDRGNMMKARKAYWRVLEVYPESPAAPEARRELGNLNITILFSGLLDEEKQEYTVRTGDTLFTIAEAFHTTPELLRKANRLSGPLIRPEQKLWVPRGRFEVAVSKSRNILMLIYNGTFFKEYSVGTGKDNCSPAGTFSIESKLVDPPWYHAGEKIPPDDPRNILGCRWMGFAPPQADYGIHGTTQPETIGTQSSAGCIRMHNEDVEELFDLVPRGTRVTVIE